MAVVVWVFAGGGEAEVRGLVFFLERHFDKCSFYRYTPVLRKPGPRPGHPPHPGYGKTGKSLVQEIKDRLKTAFTKDSGCDLILVLDDLDCRDANEQRALLLTAIDSIPESKGIDRIVAFAAPELESWIVADWGNSVAVHPDFRNRHNRMRHWLSTTIGVPFEAPETFGVYDKDRDCCNIKLSSELIHSTETDPEDANLPRYSKGLHSPNLLLEVNPAIVSRKCPIFASFFRELTARNATAK